MVRNKKFIYVQSYVLKYIHSKGLDCSENVIKSEKLNQLIKQIIDRAIERAKGNFRKTVMDRDL